jgi:hypothetical protein
MDRDRGHRAVHGGRRGACAWHTRQLLARETMHGVASLRLCLLALVPPATAAGGASYGDVRGRPYTVGLTPRGLTVDGRPQLLLSGDVHYARAMPAEQDAALDRLKADSLNTVQTYAFWSLHEPEPRTFCWGEADAASSPRCSAAGARANITRFLEAAAARDLFVVLRIGPFICGEWSYGGIPSWINGEPGVQIRAHNPSWEAAMTAFVRTVWPLVEPFTAAHGGPVVMLQLENENGRAIPGDPYTEYVASLARSLNSSLPFLWCEGGQAEIVPFNAINQSGPSPFVPAINGNDGSACKRIAIRMRPHPIPSYGIATRTRRCFCA